ncbi:glycosyltransferase family 4 protein [Aquimarina sp. ERC-38]|uniref:glycosyltransferase family 4 protein n=1 Tax=Aquimarina sp. ERC-38 TaxID=2949996 RepID=UPI0022482C65|nr:glycosyltransferase family 4 protein [Aquimarina sp. ERC-38]UZO80241.1 glycosyltransferase family 4 protein [Aquimarina sp. ERC-38]
MKIDFIIPSLNSGGAERVLVLLANHFINYYDVTVITFISGEAYILNEEIKRVQFHDNEKNKKINHTVRKLRSLYFYYSESSNKPNVIISFLKNTNLVSIITAKLRGLKIIVCEHINHSRGVSKQSNFLRKYMYRYANKLTVLTEYDIAFYKKYKVNVTVMPNPCTFNAYRANNRRQKVILAIGDLDRTYHKGFDNLIEIVEPVLKKYKDWTLKILGGGNSNKLERIIAKKQLQNKIELVGYTNKVQNFMQESEVFILSSRYEGLPMVLLEAMSQGMACTAYDCITGPSDIITDGYDGILIENQNQKAMRDSLIQLIENPDKRLVLRENSVKIVDKFSIEEIGQKWEKLFKELKL